ncbi:MAG TPA: class I SAM-dependent methyltransferase [Pyrinomonadaceae bacterium]|jgi:ubiquinone/menaquinone biosynthesis C-methylase UbiE
MKTDNSGRTAAEWNAAVYERISRPQFSWGLKVLEAVSLRGDETVLDAGCGTGRLTAELLWRLPEGRVIAVDASENMLGIARRNLSTFGDRVRFLRANASDLMLGERVDVIFSTAVFHWVTDHPRLFNNLYRTLKSGGRLIAQCGGGPNLATLLGRAEALMKTPPYAQYFVGWRSPWEYADDLTTAGRLRAAGFIDVETGLEAAPVLLANEQEYREYLTHAIFRVHLLQMGDAELGDQFISALAQAASDDDPPFQLDYWRLNMRARRP